jgi:hypothetical protein
VFVLQKNSERAHPLPSPFPLLLLLSVAADEIPESGEVEEEVPFPSSSTTTSSATSSSALFNSSKFFLQIDYKIKKLKIHTL